MTFYEFTANSGVPGEAVVAADGDFDAVTAGGVLYTADGKDSVGLVKPGTGAGVLQWNEPAFTKGACGFWVKFSAKATAEVRLFQWRNTPSSGTVGGILITAAGTGAHTLKIMQATSGWSGPAGWIQDVPLDEWLWVTEFWDFENLKVRLAAYRADGSLFGDTGLLTLTTSYSNMQSAMFVSPLSATQYGTFDRLRFDSAATDILPVPVDPPPVELGTFSASFNGEFRAATGMFASYAGQWVEVPLGGGGGTAEWVARSSVPAITSPAWSFPPVAAVPAEANLRWSVANDPDDGLPSLRIQHDGFTAASQAVLIGTAPVDAALDATLTQDALNCRAKVRLNVVTGFLVEYTVGRPESSNALMNSGGLMVAGYANLTPLGLGVTTKDTYFGQTPVPPVPEGGYGWTRLILGGNVANNVIPPLDAYLRVEWELLTMSDSGGGGGTPADPVWVEAAPIVGPLTEIENTVPVLGLTASYADGVLTLDYAATPASGFRSSYYGLLLPALDLSDDTVIYRVTAEKIVHNGTYWASTDILLAPNVGDTRASLTQLESNSLFQADRAGYPVGTVSTLGTSVQQQRLDTSEPPANNYTRQLVRVMAGQNPGIVIRASNSNAEATEAQLQIRLKVEKLVGVAEVITPDPVDAIWEDVPDAFGAVVLADTQYTLPEANFQTSFVDGILTITSDEFSTSHPGFDVYGQNFAIPINPVADIDDPTIIYRLTAELLDREDTRWFDDATVARDKGQPTPSKIETYSMLAADGGSGFPVGTIATLATSVQQQRVDGATYANGNNYERQLKRILSGTFPCVYIRRGLMGPDGVIPASRLQIRIRLEKLVGAPVSAGAIGWSDDLVTIDVNNAALWSQGVVPGYVALPGGNPRIVQSGTDVQILIDQYQQDANISNVYHTFSVPLGAVDLSGLNALESPWPRLDLVIGTGWTWFLAPAWWIVNDAQQKVLFGTVPTDGSVVPMHADNDTSAELTTMLQQVLAGVNPRLEIAMAPYTFGTPATYGPYSITLKSFSIRKQTVV